MTMLAPEKETTEVGGSLCHYAHTDCQESRPTAKMLCGLERDWSEMCEFSTLDECVVCNLSERCPVCGVMVGLQR